MDYITLKNLEFYGCHGVNEAEKNCPQKFIITVKLYLDLSRAGKSDELADTVNYSEVYKILKGIFEQQSFNLIERLAEIAATILLEKYSKLNKIDIRVKKPEAPVKGEFDYFAVNITRERL